MPYSAIYPQLSALSLQLSLPPSVIPSVCIHDNLLLLSLDVVGDVDEDASGLALHLDDDLGQRSFTDLLELGQHTSAEHDLEMDNDRSVTDHKMNYAEAIKRFY